MNESVFASIVSCLKESKDKDGLPLKMDSLMISHAGNTFRHDFSELVAAQDIRSLSKTIVCLAVGVAIGRNLMIGGRQLTEELEIWPYFEQNVHLHNVNNWSKLRQIKLKHLLNPTIGYSQGLLFSKDLKDKSLDSLIEYVFNVDIQYDPGEHFVYSNVGPYILSALIQDNLGQSLISWIDDLLFSPLNIKCFDWKKYGSYCIGSSGLVLTIQDVHKIITLISNNGQFEGKQIVPKAWVDLMRSPISLTPMMFDEKRVFPKYAYGYGLWVCKDGNYYCDGTDGQYMIVLPKRNIVITTFGHQGDMKPITECFRNLV
jgi:CubicO group peptidase (beta-lactamase class C family)